MNILIPMAGQGKRFSDAGYTISKPMIPTTCWNDGRKYPMAVCAIKDIQRLVGDGKLILAVRTDMDSVMEGISEYYPDAEYIKVASLTEGQACTCLLAKDFINNDTPLFIGGCDNGMVADKEKLEKVFDESDAVIFTYRHNDCVVDNPNAYGWVVTDGTTKAVDVSVKKAISDNPMEDHAIVASFMFKRGRDFVRCAEKMIASNDRINGEFYADLVMKYCIDEGMKVRVFEIDRYICWGTPQDYENYEKTITYWKNFIDSDAMISKE